MNSYDVYKDIAERTGGDIYIGVVGPVRTGKSTFIKNFMEKLVIPNIENEYVKTRTRDELPQSAEGTSIMTTEPKFVPNEAVTISPAEGISLNVRLIDCVGYIVDGAKGHTENNSPRMVSTPWSESKMPFAQAAELGTHKVITDHAALGLVITTDGSITDIPRESYINSEARIIKELKDTGKPFVIILNCKDPSSEQTQEIRTQMENKYKMPVLAVNCRDMTTEDISNILSEALYAFPLGEVDIAIPKWLEAMDSSYHIKSSIIESAKAMAEGINGIKDIPAASEILNENENVKKIYSENIDLGEGKAYIELFLNDNIFYDVLTETTGTEISSEFELISTIKLLSDAKKEYDKIKNALDEVNKKGYGIVTPSVEDMALEPPEVLKQGSRYGIKIKAEAPGIHLIKTNIKTTVAPIVGSEEQSKELVDYLNAQYSVDPNSIWEYSIFGRTLKELVTDDLNTKLMRLPEDTQFKFKESLQKIINEGSGGIICILL